MRLLRRYSRGFEARDGYPLDRHKLARLSPKAMQRVRHYASMIRQELASPHVEVVPRGKRARKAIETHTGQNYLKGRKRYVVHVDKPSTAAVAFKYPRKKSRPASVEVVTSFKGGSRREIFFHLADYAGGIKPPWTFEQITAITKRMVPDMPKGKYVMVTSTHGNIGMWRDRDDLIQELQEFYQGYDRFGPQSRTDDRGLASVVLGFRRVATTVEGAREEYNKRTTRTAHMAQHRRALRAREHKQRMRRLGR